MTCAFYVLSSYALQTGKDFYVPSSIIKALGILYLALMIASSLSMGFSRQKCLSRLPLPLPGDLPNQGIEPTSPVSPALQADSLPVEHQGSPLSTPVPGTY